MMSEELVEVPSHECIDDGACLPLIVAAVVAHVERGVERDADKGNDQDNWQDGPPGSRVSHVHGTERSRVNPRAIPRTVATETRFGRLPTEMGAFIADAEDASWSTRKDVVEITATI
jgi:hypothetical protein